MAVTLDIERVVKLGDRLAGAALMSEALRQGDLTAKIRTLILLFERAFATKPSHLKKPVSEFLSHWQALDYTTPEVGRWFEQIRGRAMHADKRDALVEADVRPLINRVIFAAYDALLNKRSWGTSDVQRKDRRTPTNGPLDRDGAWFVCQRTTPRTSHTVYDAFGAYPVALNSAAMDLGEDRWPRLSPNKMNAPTPTIRIMPAEELCHPHGCVASRAS